VTSFIEIHINDNPIIVTLKDNKDEPIFHVVHRQDVTRCRPRAQESYPNGSKKSQIEREILDRLSTVHHWALRKKKMTLVIYNTLGNTLCAQTIKTLKTPMMESLFQLFAGQGCPK